MKVKGILVEGRDGKEYLIGVGQRVHGRGEGPALSRRNGEAWTRLEETREASKTVREQLLDISESIGSKDTHIKEAVLAAVSIFLMDFFASARWGGP